MEVLDLLSGILVHLLKSVSHVSANHLTVQCTICAGNEMLLKLHLVCLATIHMAALEHTYSQFNLHNLATCMYK